MIKKLPIISLVLILIAIWGYFSFGNLIKGGVSEGQAINRNNFVATDTNGDGLGEKNRPAVMSRNLPQSSERAMKMLFFGDLMLDRHVGEKIQKYGLDYLFEKLDKDELFKGRDLISVNLEGAVTNEGAHYLPANSYDFAFQPELIDDFKKYNFNFFNLANNHLADQGERGIIETRENLDSLNFNYAGCNDGQVGDCSFKKLGIGNWELGMAGFSMIYKRFDLVAAVKIVETLASTTDLVIVNIHWGAEYEHQFDKAQQDVGHELIDAGADIIIGHHPHVVQGMELFNDKPIFYSLGNFIFDQYFSLDTQEELAVGIDWIVDDDKNPPYPPLLKGVITLLPMESVGSQPYLLAGLEKEKFLEKFVNWSRVDENDKKQIKEGKIILSF